MKYVGKDFNKVEKDLYAKGYRLASYGDIGNEIYGEQPWEATYVRGREISFDSMGYKHYTPGEIVTLRYVMKSVGVASQIATKVFYAEYVATDGDNHDIKDTHKVLKNRKCKNCNSKMEEPLVCKTCGYKQYDLETIKEFRKKYPGTENHDIPYTCGACMDNYWLEDEGVVHCNNCDAVFSDQNCPDEERNVCPYCMESGCLMWVEPSDDKWIERYENGEYEGRKQGNFNKKRTTSIFGRFRR